MWGLVRPQTACFICFAIRYLGIIGFYVVRLTYGIMKSHILHKYILHSYDAHGLVFRRVRKIPSVRTIVRMEQLGSK